MIELRGTVDYFLRSITKKDNRIQFVIADISDPQLIEDLKGKDLDITVKVHREKRSLNANAYFWSLCNELGNVLHISKDEVHDLMLKRYGQRIMTSVRSDIDPSRFFQYYEEIGKGEINGKEFTHYNVFGPSHEYDTKEMSILIDGVVQEAKAQGIQVMSDQELSLLKESWNNEINNSN